MTVPTWYVDTLPAVGQSVRMGGSAHHYLARVLRVMAGESLRLCDGAGQIARARVLAVDDVGVDALVETVETAPQRRFGLTLVASPLKRKGTDFLAARCAELGVDRLVLVRMDRSIARLEDDRLDRLERVSAEAARQVGQPEVTRLELKSSLAGAIESLQMPNEGEPPSSLRGTRLFFLWEEGGQDVRDLRLQESAGAVCVVGPEGGFSERETSMLQESGATPVFFRGAAYRAATAAVIGAVLFLHAGGRL